MAAEKSAGAIIFKDTKRGRKFLLLQHPDKLNNRSKNPKGGHWDFPKGHIEKGEKVEDTVKREVWEETGIKKIKIIPGFSKTIRYYVGKGSKRRMKFVVFFLARTKNNKVKISHEHQAYKWLSFEDACRQITYLNSKNTLKNAGKFFQGKNI